jgi:anti-sigma B factor antagonist
VGVAEMTESIPDVEMEPEPTIGVGSPSDGCRIVAAGGELDLHTVPQLRERLHAVLAEPGITHLVIDLSEATFLDSSALGVLVGALKRVKEAGGHLDIVLPTSPLRRIFEITALDRVLVLHETRAEALSGR